MKFQYSPSVKAILTHWCKAKRHDWFLSLKGNIETAYTSKKIWQLALQNSLHEFHLIIDPRQITIDLTRPAHKDCLLRSGESYLVHCVYHSDQQTMIINDIQGIRALL